MNILPALKFVKGAVAKKDFAPALEHFRINRGRVLGYNGAMAISSPINIDLDVCPKALQFIKAIDACQGTISLGLTDAGKVVVTSEKFRCVVDCEKPENYPTVLPQGQRVELTQPGLLDALTYLEPFIADDASRPWACAVLLDGYSAFATNNVVLMQYWLGWQFPKRVCIPSSAVKEVIRVGEEPTAIQFDERRVFFHYKGDRWISCQLIEQAWPPNVSQLLEQGQEGGPGEEVGEVFFDAVEQLLPFTDELNRIYFLGDKMSTVAKPDGAGSIVAICCPTYGCYNGKHLLNLRDVVSHIQFSAYPSSVPFVGQRVRGRIAGLR